MASGDVVGIFYRVQQPSTLFATPSGRVGGSTPNEVTPVWDFDDGAGDGTSEGECLDFFGQMSGRYSGGGVTVQIKWIAKTSSTTAHNVFWRAAFRRIAEVGDDLDISQTYDFNSTTSAVPTSSGQVRYAAITFTSGADMDSVVAGDMFILRINRFGDNAADTMSGDASLIGVVVLET